MHDSPDFGAANERARDASGTIVAAGAIVYRPSRGFLLLRNRDYWEFPKGRSDAGDASVEATALREVREESGLTITLVEGFCEVEEYRVTSGPKAVTFFLGLTEGDPQISNEHRGFCWCTPREVLRFLTYDTKKRIFRKALAMLRARGLLRPEDEIEVGRSLRPNTPHKPGGSSHGKQGRHRSSRGGRGRR